MLPKDFFNAWNEVRSISFQIAETMKTDKNFKGDFKPHPDMKDFGDNSSHIIKAVYFQFNNYLKRNIPLPEVYKAKPFTYDLFVQGLKETDILVQDLYTSLSMDDLSKEAFVRESTKASHSVGWVVFNLINHERWHQAQLKMYLKIMGCDTSKIGH